MNSTHYFSIKELLPQLTRGAPVSTRQLVELGVRPRQAASWARSGWLTRLGEETYQIPGDTLDQFSCIAFLAEKIPGLHVGGKTALSWRGVKHNLAVKERILLWGSVQVKLPRWFIEQFDCRYQVTNIFDSTLPPRTGLSPLPGGNTSVQVSTPERALLELLSDVGKSQSLEETKNLVENIRNLRIDVLDELLQHTARIKVVRMACEFGDELGLPWAALAQKHSARLGGGKRWIAVAKTGETLVLKIK